MKKYTLMFLTGVLCLSLAACGKPKAETTPTPDPDPTEQVDATNVPTTDPTETGTPEGGDTFADNFAVSAEAAAAFAKSVQDAVAAKDMEQLADLMNFPCYIGSTDENNSVETREDFIALGADKIFTDALVESIADADIENLSASKAGFVLCGNEDGRPNIIFGVNAEGALAITGINY